MGGHGCDFDDVPLEQFERFNGYSFGLSDGGSGESRYQRRDGRESCLASVIESMTDAKGVVIGVEDSVDAFSASVARYTFSVKGPIAQPTELTISAKDFQMNRLGVASAVLRARVVAIDSAATVKFSVFVDH